MPVHRHRPRISPSIPVQLTSSDYAENRDPVLDAVLGQIRARKP